MPDLTLSTLLVWRPVLPAVALAAVMLLLAVMLAWQARFLRARFAPRHVWPIIAVRSLTVLLLGLALLDPAYTRRMRDAVPRHILVLTDRSESMKVRDDGLQTREQRADAIAEHLARSLPRHVRSVRWSFADSVWPDGAPAPQQVGGTDMAGALQEAADSAGDTVAVVLLSDGGDEPPDPIRLPRAPIFACAIGSDLEGWRDTAVTALQGPETAERSTTFELTATFRATGREQNGFRDILQACAVKLWHQLPNGSESLAAEQVVDLRSGEAACGFPVQCDEEGVHRFRVELLPAAGELSPLNNQRTHSVEARRESLDVLYFSRRLGADLKRLRQALSADPALAFTALYLTGGERYTVQAPDGVDTTELLTGLPTAPEALRRFNCILLGSFPAHLWSSDEMRAMLTYVEEGGGVIWLGGDESFEGGGYGASALAPLLPWQLTGETSTLLREEAPLRIPPSAAGDPVVAGLHDLLAAAGQSAGGAIALPSFNRVQNLSPAARVLLEAETPSGRTPILITQPYGRGQIVVLASNTSWQWAGGTLEASTFYRRLWQQLVRAAAGRTDGGRHLQVIWEGNRLRPAGRTSARIRMIDAQGATLRASLSAAEGERALPLTATDEPDAWQVNLAFHGRGEYLFRLEALRDMHPLDVYEKRLSVAPPQDEGTRLERHVDWLEALASRTAGRCYTEETSDQLATDLQAAMMGQEMTEQVSVVSHHPWVALALLATLLAEWLLRRRRNLF